MEETKPHIAFTMSSAPIEAALHLVGIDSSQTISATPPRWPSAADWSPYVSARREPVHGLLPAAAADEIEGKLAALEDAFTSCLQAGVDQVSEKIRDVGTGLDAVEALLRAGGTHATYPYFARWFLLEVAVMFELTKTGAATHADQLDGVRLWWRCREYLQRTFQDAYAYRAGQLQTRVTGASGDRVYVFDTREARALTHDVAAGSQGSVELDQVLRCLTGEAGWTFIQDLAIADGAELIALAHAAISVTPESRTLQSQLTDPKDFWQSLLESIEAEIAFNRAACGPVLQRLAIPAVPAVAEPVAEEAAPAGAKAADKPEYWNLIESVVPGLIGMIPVIGPAVSVIYTQYFRWIGDALFTERPDPFIEFEKKMKALIADKLADSNANTIKNALKGFDYSIAQLVQDIARIPNPTSAQQLEFKTRALTLMDDLVRFKYQILQPASGSFYRVAPYWQRYFIDFQFILALCESRGATTYNYRQLRKDLYAETNTFVAQAIDGIARERIDRIRIKNTDNGCGDDILEVFDYRTNKTLSANLANKRQDLKWYCVEGSRFAAGTASAIQLMRTMTREIDGIIINDKEVVNNPAMNFPKNTIERTYYNRIWHWNGQVWSHYQCLVNLGQTQLLSPDIGPFSNMTEAQRTYFETSPEFPAKNNILLVS